MFINIHVCTRMCARVYNNYIHSLTYKFCYMYVTYSCACVLLLYKNSFQRIMAHYYEVQFLQHILHLDQQVV